MELCGSFDELCMVVEKHRFKLSPPGTMTVEFHVSVKTPTMTQCGKPASLSPCLQNYMQIIPFLAKRLPPNG